MNATSGWLDLFVGFWAIAACAVFGLVIRSGGWSPLELELVGRSVYVVVIVGGIAGLAIRAIRKARGKDTL